MTPASTPVSPPAQIRVPATPEQLLQHLDRLGIGHSTVHHAQVMTVDENKRLGIETPGLHSKNLFLKDKKGGLFLVVAHQDCPVDLKSLRKRLGLGNLSFASADVLYEVLGVQPGSVTPFAVLNDGVGRVTLVLDKTLSQSALVSFHPLINTQTTTISGADLLTFLHAVAHDPIIIDFTPDPEI